MYYHKNLFLKIVQVYYSLIIGSHELLVSGGHSSFKDECFV